MASEIALALQANPRRRLRRPRLQRYPLTIERRYASELRGIAEEAIEVVSARVLPHLDRWARMAGVRTDSLLCWHNEPFSSSEIGRDIRRAINVIERGDQIGDWLDELELEFTTIRREFGRQDGQLRQIAETTATETSSFNRIEVGRQISRVVGGDIIPFSDDTDTIKGFIQQNVSFIKTIPEQHFARIEQIIGDGFRGGRRAEAIRGQIQEVGGVTKRRAQFIARDQISSLNGQLTKRRQESLGVERYIWRTSLDERVRPAHAALEGSEQSWDDPPTVGQRQVHPGEDYNCRCTAEPVIEGIEPEKTGPEDVPPPLPTRGRAPRARGARRSVSYPTAGPGRRRPTVTIPVSAKPETVTRPRTGKPIELSAEQVLRRDVAEVLTAYPELRREATTNQRLDRLLWNWVHGTNRKASVELKEAAQKEFGLRGIAFNRNNRRIDPRDVRQSQKDLRALYRSTQKHLAERGQKTITVYRGYRTARAERGAVESWSTSEAEARKFAGREGGVVRKQVPVERVLALKGGPHWLDGIFGDQSEVMLLF